MLADLMTTEGHLDYPVATGHLKAAVGTAGINVTVIIEYHSDGMSENAVNALKELQSYLRDMYTDVNDTPPNW